MQRYPDFFELYDSTEPQIVNEQLVNLCSLGMGDNISIVKLMAQYKYCNLNNIKDWRLQALRDQLSKTITKDILDMLEVRN